MAKKFILIENDDIKNNDLIDYIIWDEEELFTIWWVDLFYKEKKDTELIYIIKKNELNVNLDNYFLYDNYQIKDYKIDVYINFRRNDNQYSISYLNNNYMNLTKNSNIKNYNILKERWFPEVHLTTAIIENNNEIIWVWDNSDFHFENWCIRKKELLSKSGDAHDVCKWCRHTNHWEQMAIKYAIKNLNEEKLKWSNLYLYWHYCPCLPCSYEIDNYKIKNVYLSKEFTKEFLNIKDFKNKESLL